MTIATCEVDGLRWMQSIENNGRGVSCARNICACLDDGDINGAKAVAHNEWDKLRNYPNIVAWLKEKNIAEKDWF